MTEGSNTVYIRNINEKIKIPALKSTLRNLFSQFGEILDIVAHANIRMRGQAFVVFHNKDHAAKAIREVQGFPIYGKPMNLDFARKKSDAVAAFDGTLEQQKAVRLAFKAQLNNNGITRKKRKGMQGQEMDAKRRQAQPAPYPANYSLGQYVADEFLPPNQILFLQQIPPGVTEDQLTLMFQGYSGFKEVRLVPTRHDIAFVEYESDQQAGVAKDALNGKEIIPGHAVKVSFARK